MSISTQVTVRVERATGAYALFFYAAGELTCYTRAEGHNVASIDYMRAFTSPAWHGPAGWGAEAMKLWHSWCGIGEPSPCHLVRRLSHRSA